MVPYLLLSERRSEKWFAVFGKSDAKTKRRSEKWFAVFGKSDAKTKN